MTPQKYNRVLTIDEYIDLVMTKVTSSLVSYTGEWIGQGNLTRDSETWTPEQRSRFIDVAPPEALSGLSFGGDRKNMLRVIHLGSPVFRERMYHPNIGGMFRLLVGYKSDKNVYCLQSALGPASEIMLRGHLSATLAHFPMLSAAVKWYSI